MKMIYGNGSGWRKRIIIEYSDIIKYYYSIIIIQPP